MKRKRITYKQFCQKFGDEYGDSLRPDSARQIAKKNGYSIADLHNIVEVAKIDNRI